MVIVSAKVVLPVQTALRNPVLKTATTRETASMDSVFVMMVLLEKTVLKSLVPTTAAIVGGVLMVNVSVTVILPM